MGRYLDDIPFSGIIRIRDLMYSVERPFRLDQGDVSFPAPASFKDAVVRALAENRTHYVQTTGIPPLIDRLVEKLRTKNRIPVDQPDDVMVTTGGIHGVFAACQALFDRGDEVLLPDPEWPPTRGNLLAAGAVPVGYGLYESRDWRPDLDEIRRLVTPRTRGIYVNSPHNPSGGVLTRDDLAAIADLARERNLWVISDEAYEDIVFDGREHVSIASLPGMHERTVSIFTMSKTYAITGVRVGYLAVANPLMRERIRKVISFTVSNTCSLSQYGALGALEGSQAAVEEFRRELAARRDLFYDGLAVAGGGVLTGDKPAGAFYAFVHVAPTWTTPLPLDDDSRASRSWAMAEFLIKRARIGCVPGVDFGPRGEGYLRFCFARERDELTGALQSMHDVLAVVRASR